MSFFNIIQAIFWFLICLDNTRVILPLYSRAVGRNPNAKYEPIMKTLEATLSCDFKLVGAKLPCDFKIPALVPIITLSSELGARQAQREVVKIKKNYFSYWA